jgi:hypothetical protein
VELGVHLPPRLEFLRAESTRIKASRKRVLGTVELDPVFLGNLTKLTALWLTESRFYDAVELMLALAFASVTDP